MKPTKFILFLLTLLLFTACDALTATENEEEETIPTTAEELEVYEYEIPLIFHVLYNNSSSSNVTVEQSRLSEIVSKVNTHYSGSLGGEDMDIKFYLASESSDGVPLEEAGVNRVYVSGSYPMSYEDVMSGTEYKGILWDPNEYINVLLYAFDTSSTLGVSWMPYMNSSSEGLIEGINSVSQTYLTLDNLKFTYCICVNSTYINNQSTEEYYDGADVTVTLAHELGHYLGLHHVFSEQEDGAYADSFDDTDYCYDTESYNRLAYELSVTDLLKKKETTYYDLILRENVDGEEFTSDNYMDYYFSTSDHFSADQRARTRAVLNYGLAIPGPKVVTKSANVNVVEGIIDDLPTIMVECNKQIE